MNERILNRLMDMVRARYGDAAKNLTPQDDLYEALGIDSMQAMDLLTDVEDEFDVEIPDYELQGVRSFASIAQIVEQRL